MALQKDKIIKGITLGYWKIISCDVKTGEVSMGLYSNRDSAQTHSNKFDCFNTVVNFPIDVVNPISYAYGKIKESKTEQKLIVSGKQAILDTDGNVLEEEVPAIYETIETNWFANAVDC